MSKNTPVTTALGRPSKVLSAKDHAKIRRLEQLSILKNRLEKIIKEARATLDPRIDAELKIDGEKNKKSYVIVGQNLVIISRIDKDTPKYKGICEKYIDEKTLAAALEDREFLTASTQYKAESKGRAMNMIKVIPQEADNNAKGRKFKLDEEEAKAA